MKRVFIVALCLLFTVSAFSQTITVLAGPDTKFDASTGIPSYYGYAESLLKKDYPNVKVKWLVLDLSDGSTLTMDALLAAGTPPNVYIDSTVRASKYMVPEYALPLDTYIRDLDKYYPTSLEMFRVNGKLLGLPNNGSAQGMAINLDIMKEIGYTVPDNWTIDDFLKMAELVKQKYNGKKWATGMFAGNQSGDYLINNWFASFGANWYNNKNYDKAVVADNGGAKVYEFYQTLVKNGYVPPNCATLVDDDYIIQWASGNLAATAFFPNWCKPYFDTVIQQGIIDKPFNYKFVPFPRAKGVTKVGTYADYTAIVVHKTGKEEDKIAARLAEYLNNPVTGNLFAEMGCLVDRKDVKPCSDVHFQQVTKIVQENGIFDFGLSDRRFTERRALQYPILQQVLMLKITPETAIKKFQDALSSVK